MPCSRSPDGTFGRRRPFLLGTTGGKKKKSPLVGRVSRSWIPKSRRTRSTRPFLCTFKAHLNRAVLYVDLVSRLTFHIRTQVYNTERSRDGGKGEGQVQAIGLPYTIISDGHSKTVLILAPGDSITDTKDACDAASLSCECVI